VFEIAEHEHLPEILAAALGHTLLKSPNGVDVIRSYLLENLEKARSQGDAGKVRHVDMLIKRFMLRAPRP
jgi:hypothetical protein